MKIGKQTTYSYSLGLDLSLDTHIDDLIAFFQNINKSLFMFTKCKQTTIENKKTYSYSLGLDLSSDTHNDDLLAFFQNVNKSLFMFTKCKQTQKSKIKKHILTPYA